MNERRRKLYEKATDQHGLVTHGDLVALGFTEGERRGLYRAGVLERIGRQVYRLGGSVPNDHQRVMAACLEVDGVASHGTAAWLHGIGRYRPGRPPDVTSPRPLADYRHPLGALHTTTWLPAYDVVSVDGIPCFGVARTLFSLAAAASDDDLEPVRDAVDIAIRDRKATEAWLYWRLERLRRRGRPGIRRFQVVLDGRRTDGATESWLEREFLRLLRSAGIPLPVCQERVRHEGSFVARVDFLYAEPRIVIEVAGYENHSTRRETAADAERRTNLVLAGYRVVELTYDDVVRRPEWVIARIHQALRSVAAA